MRLFAETEPSFPTSTRLRHSILGSCIHLVTLSGVALEVGHVASQRNNLSRSTKRGFRVTQRWLLA